jgi:hypothetical protein
MKTQAINYLNGLITEDTTKKQIDLIDFIKRCVREFKEEKTETAPEWEQYFDSLWKVYPKKSDKLTAKKTMEHKVRGLTDEECRAKCREIYKLEMKYIKECQDSEREMQYIKMFSTFLNSCVPNSPHYKGR